MSKKRVLFILLLAAMWIEPACAFDWKKTHEAADHTTLEEALANVALAPDSSSSRYLLGLVYLNLYRDEEANACFNTILASDPGSVPARWGLAEVLRRRHELTDATAQLQALIKEDPSFIPAFISLSYLRFVQADFQSALRLAHRVVVQGSENVDTSNFVRAYLLTAASKGMIAHYGGPVAKLVNGTSVYPVLKKARALQPRAAGVLFGLGSFYLLAPRIIGGNVEEAQKYLEEAIDADPHLIDAYVRLAQVYKLRGDTERYRDYLHKALTLDPHNEIALDIQNGRCRFICVGE